MPYDNRLYLILHPNNALVASQLSPEQFAKHYTSGSSRHYSGKVVFAEVDPSFRHEFFCIDALLGDVKPHEDGRPKATKFIATYRVLEHVPFDAVLSLYISTQEGYCIELPPGPYQAEHQPGFIRLFAEISPLRMLVLSEYDFPTFGELITDPKNPKSAPKQFYTQYELDFDEFIEEFEANPLRPSPIKSVHPSTLRDGFFELKRVAEKHSKGVALDSNLDSVSYKRIRHGFMLAGGGEHKFFPMPSLAEIERTNLKFWKTM